MIATAARMRSGRLGAIRAGASPRRASSRGASPSRDHARRPSDFQNPWLSAFTAEMRRSQSRTIAARFDSAGTSPLNQKHWAGADSLSADAALRPEVRMAIVQRARYEVTNNPLLDGMVRVLCRAMISRGPTLRIYGLTSDTERQRRLRLKPTKIQRELNVVAREFNEWAKAVKLGRKLRTMRRAKCVDGEAFAILSTNPQLDHDVTLEVRPIETDRVTSRTLGMAGDDVDGITFDAFGNVSAYNVLKRHPGSLSTAMDFMPPVQPRQMLHWYREDRPGQSRGVSEIQAALPMMAVLRRFIGATLGAAEFAAAMAAVFETSSPDGEVDSDFEPFDTIDFEHNGGMNLPLGWKLNQLKPAHPSASFPEFIATIIAISARTIEMPYILAAGDSSKSNFASAKLDRQPFQEMVRVDREEADDDLLRQLLDEWLKEAKLVGLPVPAGVRASRLRYRWVWPGFASIDEGKAATALRSFLEMGGATLTDHYDGQGIDIVDALSTRADEINLMRELGIPIVTPSGNVIDDGKQTTATAPAAGEEDDGTA